MVSRSQDPGPRPEVNTHHLCPGSMVCKAPARSDGGDDHGPAPSTPRAQGLAPATLGPATPRWLGAPIFNSPCPRAWTPRILTGPARAGWSCPGAATGRRPCRSGTRGPAALGGDTGLSHSRGHSLSSSGPRGCPRPQDGPLGVTPHTYPHADARTLGLLPCQVPTWPKDRRGSHEGGATAALSPSSWLSSRVVEEALPARKGLQPLPGPCLGLSHTAPRSAVTPGALAAHSHLLRLLIRRLSAHLPPKLRGQSRPGNQWAGKG